MSKTEDRITTSQAAVFVSSFMLGVGILTLPRSVTEVVNSTDGWISILLGEIFVILVSYIMIKLCQRFPNKSFYEFSEEIAGKWIGKLLSSIVILYFIMAAGYEIRGMAEVTKLYLLPRTPMLATVIPFIFLGTYLVSGGINPMVRFFEATLPTTLIFLLIVFVLSLKSFDIINLRPVLGSGVWPVIKGVKTTFLSFTGFEVMLIVTSFMREPNKALKSTIIGTCIPVLFYLIAVVCTIGALGVEGTMTKTWPTLSLLRQFEYTGVIFERFETFLLAVWIIQIFNTFVASYYFACLGLKQLFHKKKIQSFIYGLTPIIFLITIAPKNINDLFHFATFESNIIIIFIVPPILLLISSIKMRRMHK